MNDEILSEFLNGEARIAWKTQDELECMADLIDRATGLMYCRDYIRGYTPDQYAYFGFDKNGDGRHDSVYCLWKSSNDITYSAEEFMAEFGAGDEDKECDITSLI